VGICHGTKLTYRFSLVKKGFYLIRSGLSGFFLVLMVGALDFGQFLSKIALSIPDHLALTKKGSLLESYHFYIFRQA